jgi:phospholipid/cholesterol/gamma-HCH transport system substrate-binding protein
MLSSEAKGNIQQTLSNLNQASNSLSKLLNNETGALARTMNNATAITDNIKNNNDSITAAINNTKKLTQKLANLELEQTIDSIQAVVTQLKTTIAKISSPNGTLGALISDKKLYDKLTDAILSAEILMDDIRAHPKRYVNISVFGKKDKGGELTSPSKKDTIPGGDH